MVSVSAMSNFPLIALTALTAILFSSGHVPAGEGAADLLRRLAAAAPQAGIVAEFRETKSLALLREPVVETGTLAWLRPDYFRRTVTGPVPSTTLFDGSSLWVVFPDEKLAEHYPARANRAIRDSLAAIPAIWDPARMEERFRVEAAPEGGGHVLRLTPRGRSLSKSLTRVDVVLDASLRVKEIRVEAADGNRSRIEILKESRQNLSPEDFRFNPQKGGYRVVAPLGGT